MILQLQQKENKESKVSKILKIILAVFLFLSVIPLTANAYSNITPSADYFQDVYCKVSIEVTFNATNIGGKSVTKTATHSVLLSTKVGSAGTESDTLYAYTKAYYSISEQQFFEKVFGARDIVYPKTNLSTANYVTGGLYFNSTTFYNTSYRILTNNASSGIGLIGVIPDARSIAADYCRKHKLALGSIINISRRIDYKSNNVKDVILGFSRPLRTDSNLDDGYNIQVEAHQGWEAAALVLAGIAIAFGVMTLINTWLSKNVEQRQRLDENLDINVPGGNNTVSNFLNNHTNIINIEFPSNDSLTTAYNIYDNLTKGNGTAEGFVQFIRSLYPDLASPVITYTTIINQSQSQAARANQTQAASQVAVFAESTQQIITLIIIIIVSVIAVAIVIKLLKRKSSYSGGVTVIDTD